MVRLLLAEGADGNAQGGPYGTVTGSMEVIEVSYSNEDNEDEEEE